MLVMLSCGPSSNQIVKTVSNQIDNVDFHCYFSVKEFISQSKLRHLAFDRLVFTSRFISNDNDMGILCDYVRRELNSTEIVMILPKSQKDLEGVFTKYFDSPMYTIMYVDSPTTMCIVDAIKLPVADVKARYYCFDKPSEESGEKKNSKIGVFKGGKKNKNQKSEMQDSSPEEVKTPESVGESSGNDANGFGFETSVNSPTIGTIPDINVNIGNGDISKNNEFLDDVSNSDGNRISESQNSPNTSDEFDLSIGDYGSQHTDSGFVGDDELDELKEFASRQENGNVAVECDDSDVGKISVVEEATVIPPVGVNAFIGSKINIAIGVNGSGVSAYVVNSAIELSKQGYKVLIVDLDYENNGVLSFLDVNKFYSSGCNLGINRKRAYYEDGIAVLSNGYGMGLDIDLHDIFESSFLADFDIVLVDCPIECLSVIPEDIFCTSPVVVGCISDISKLIETSAKLSNRNMVSLSKEVHIINYAKVANKYIKKQDISLLKDLMLFPNGCWLDNYS